MKKKKLNLKSSLISSAIQEKETLDQGDAGVHVTKIVHSIVGWRRLQIFPTFSQIILPM